MATALANHAAPPDDPTPGSSPAEVAVSAAFGVVIDIEERLSVAREAGEQISDARRPLAFDASRGDAGATQRLAELTRDAAQNRQDIADLETALAEARSRLANAEAAARAAADQRVLDHARELAAEFIEQSQLIDDALATIVAAHAECRRLASAIVASGCLHPSRYSWLDCPTRMACALAVAGASPIVSPGQPPFTDKVFAIHTLARSDRETLSNLAVANRNSRSSF